VLFSRNAVIAPYREGTGFEFRIVNERRSQLIQVELQVIFSRRLAGGQRRFDTLRLERSTVVFFPLHWTVVHPIDAQSPLFGLGQEDLAKGDAEFLILLTAIDETFSQTVHARSSYRAEEVVVGARFQDVIRQGPEGRLGVDLRRFHGLDRVELPVARE
jgi:inward rectifier potassium channel